MTRYILLPAEGMNSTAKEIEIPQGLVHDSNAELFKRVRDTDLLKDILLKLAKAEISSDQNGMVKHRSGTLESTSFRDAVVDSCNGLFKGCYEQFYCLLRNHGITF